MKPIDLAPISLAIACYVLAAILYSLNPTAAVALVGLGGTLTGVALPQFSAALAARRAAQASEAVTTVERVPPKDAA